MERRLAWQRPYATTMMRLARWSVFVFLGLYYYCERERERAPGGELLIQTSAGRARVNCPSLAIVVRVYGRLTDLTASG